MPVSHKHHHTTAIIQVSYRALPFLYSIASSILLWLKLSDTITVGGYTIAAIEQRGFAVPGWWGWYIVRSDRRRLSPYSFPSEHAFDEAVGQE
jgi:hypothetical protein